MAGNRRPLAGLTIVEIVGAPLAPAMRTLAELGAHVVHLSAQDQRPSPTREALAELAANIGKTWRTIDPKTPGGQAVLAAEIAGADAVLIDTENDIGRTLAGEIGALRARHPGTVFVTCSAFGMGNPMSGWTATDPVLHALAGNLSRSGILGRAPLLPPAELAMQSAAVQLAYVTLLAIFHSLQTGMGDHVDFAALEGAMQALDPGFGIGGSATLGRPAAEIPPGRPPRGFQYPILPCADGHVRICVLAVRQWRGMFEWMGRPEEFASPEYEKLAVRYKSERLNPAIGAFFAHQTRAELEEGARRHGVPLSALLSGEEALEAEHFRTRQSFVDVDVPGLGPISLPNGLLEIDGARMSAIGQTPPHDAGRPHVPAPRQDGLPLSGLKVLDLGVIVVGAEQARLLADAGADVVKLESRAFPDGTRQSYLSIGLSAGFAAGHRNKRSLGLNLRDEEGRALFERMVADCDVVLTNFKPGTLESLGLGHDRLSAINPGVIVVESSAFGSSGPWAGRMGYGPLVRAATGLTAQWRYPDDPESYSDSITIYPDHVAGRITAIGVLALLIDRARHGRGGHIGSSQAEVVLAQQAWQIAAARSGLVDPAGPPDAPWGVFACAGDDQWCAITVRGDDDWKALCSLVPGLDPALPRDQRLARRADIEAQVQQWTALHAPAKVMEMLQERGVPAGQMLRIGELPELACLAQRGTLRVERHPYLDEPVYSEARPARFANIAPPPARPAPLMGEQTEEIMREWLGLGDADIADLVTRGVLEPLSHDIRQSLMEMTAYHGKG